MAIIHPETVNPNTHHEAQGIQVAESSRDRFPMVGEQVHREVAMLREQGIDVSIVDVEDGHALDEHTQARIDAEIGAAEENPFRREIMRQKLENNPGASRWLKVGHGAAIGLFPAYIGTQQPTLGNGISPDAYDDPIFKLSESGSEGDKGQLLTARQVLAKNNEVRARRKGYSIKSPEEEANVKVAEYQDFIDTPYSNNADLVTILGGSIDGRAVRTRAQSGIDMVVDHFEQTGGLDGRHLTTASLGCGAAVPIFELLHKLNEYGTTVDKAYLVDQDPMALASSHSLAETYEVDGITDVRLLNLLLSDLEGELGHTDVNDLLGVTEYLNDRLAVRLLASSKKMLNPGGISVFANMLPERPQQNYFYEVLDWPKLHQRSVADMLRIAEQAGYDVSKAKVRIPGGEGVYAVYAIPTTM